MTHTPHPPRLTFLQAGTPAAPEEEQQETPVEQVEETPAAEPAPTTEDTADTQPDLVETFVSDLAAHRAAYGALQVPRDGSQWVHAPGAGLVPEAEVRSIIGRLGGQIDADAEWPQHVRVLEVTDQHLRLVMDSGKASDGAFYLAACGFRVNPASGVAEGAYAGLLAYKNLSAEVPQLTDLYSGTEEYWARTWHRLGISESSRRQDGSETVTIPNPVGFTLLPDGRGCMRLRTPISKPIKAWEQRLGAIQAKLKRKIELIDLAPNIVGIAPPAKTQTMTPWIPNADEQLHVTAPTPEAFVAGALAAYPHLAWVQGRALDGQVLQQPMARVPHALVGGGTGSGKSTWASWLMTACALAGADIIICDGKGSSDYVDVSLALPNVVMYSATDAEHIRALQWIHAEMQHRYRQQKSAATRGEKYDPRPLICLFDEYAAFVEGVTTKGHPQNAGWEDVEAQLTQVLQKARAVKIHVLFVAQTLYASTFPGKMKGNIQCRLSLGVPEPYTLQTVAGDAYQQAKEISRQIPRGKPGQGVAVTTSPDGEAVAQRVSVAYGFVPGRPAPDRMIRERWRTLQPAFESIPRVTPRIAPVYDAEVEPAGRKKGDELPADWRNYSCQELAQLPWARVGHSDLIGAPLPEAARYDPLSTKYAGDTLPDATGYNTYH